MDELTQFLRRVPRSIADGVAAFRDLLLWGRVYPRSISLEALRRMREAQCG